MENLEIHLKFIYLSNLKLALSYSVFKNNCDVNDSNTYNFDRKYKNFYISGQQSNINY